MNPTNSQAALAQLQDIQSKSQDPNTILSGQRQQLGVNAAQDTVTGLRGAINNTTKLLQQVAPSVMGRTGNSLVTNAQANRIIQNEQAPISQNLSQEGTQYNQANTDLQNLQQQAEAAASGIYQGQQDKLSYAQNIYNTLYQKERDAQAAQQAEADRQEQIRQFNASLAGRSSGGASGNGGGRVFNLGNPPNPQPPPPAAKAPTLTGGKTLNDAATALKALLSTGNPATIRNTIGAIQKSAQYGNTYDQAKLQLINSRPEFRQFLANFGGATF